MNFLTVHSKQKDPENKFYQTAEGFFEEKVQK